MATCHRRLSSEGTTGLRPTSAPHPIGTPLRRALGPTCGGSYVRSSPRRRGYFARKARLARHLRKSGWAIIDSRQDDANRPGMNGRRARYARRSSDQTRPARRCRGSATRCCGGRLGQGTARVREDSWTCRAALDGMGEPVSPCLPRDEHGKGVCRCRAHGAAAQSRECLRPRSPLCRAHLPSSRRRPDAPDHR